MPRFSHAITVAGPADPALSAAVSGMPGAEGRAVRIGDEWRGPPHETQTLLIHCKRCMVIVLKIGLFLMRDSGSGTWY